MPKDRVVQADYNKRNYQAHLSERRNYARNYYKTHKQQRKEYNASYRASHKEELAMYNHKQYIDHYDRRLMQARVSSGARRLSAYAVLGGCCSMCGETDPMVLEFNHLNGGGKEHRRVIGSSHGDLERWILSNKENARQQLELLCANCHARKHSSFNRIEGYQDVIGRRQVNVA